MDTPDISEGQPKTEQGLLPLSDITGRQLEQELGLDEKPTEESVKITHSPLDSSVLLTRENTTELDFRNISERFAISVFRKLRKANPEVFDVIIKQVENKFRYGSSSQHDFTIGMAIVLESFDFESGNQLISSFQHITPEEVDEVLTKLLLIKPDVMESISIFDKVKHQEPIPDEQVVLNSILKKVKEREREKVFFLLFLMVQKLHTDYYLN